MRRQAPKGETLALLGHNHHPNELRRCPPGAPATCHTCQRSPSTLPHAPEIVQLPWWRPVHQGQRPSAKGLIPIGQVSAKNVLMRASFFFYVQGLVINSVLPLPSQRPSDGLFSPMEVRTDHLPMCTDPLVPVRRAWSCTSKTTPSRGSSVLDIIAM
jgi:hypothetical protein